MQWSSAAFVSAHYEALRASRVCKLRAAIETMVVRHRDNLPSPYQFAPR
jgi:hypothetical protein